MVSSQQRTAAVNIQRVFLEKKLRYAILKSQCQAGKTGAFQELIRVMLRDNQVTHAYVLCGSSELELRSQAIEDTKKHNAEAYAAGKIQVLFRQDFAAAELDISKALIVVDESHLDQTQGQQLDQLLGRYGLSMDGNPGVLATKDAFIVSVDATPYSELAALEHKETPYQKHVEELEPGSEYVGISHYLYQRRLLPTFNIAENPGRFAMLFPAGSSKYALVRLQTGRKGKNVQEAAIEKVCRTMGFALLHYTAARTDIAVTRVEQVSLAAEGRSVPCLEDAPSRNTVVLIRGRLRAGKVVPKKHIAFVWEGAATSKTDALVQGLPGRMCGYPQDLGEEDDVMKLDPFALPMLFAPPSSLQRKETKVVKASEFERAILVPHVLPTKATNLKKPQVATEAKNRRGEKVTQCPPIRIDFGAEDELAEFTKQFKKEYQSGEPRAQLLLACYNLLTENLNLIRNSTQLSADQKKEILDVIIPEAIKKGFDQTHTANFTGNAQKSFFRNLLAGYESGTASVEDFSVMDPLNFGVVYADFQEPHASPFHLYVVFYTKAAAGVKWVQSAHLNSRIPKTNGRSIFSFHERATAVPLVAAGATGFSEANLKTPEAFKAALQAYLTHWRSSELTVTRQIQSNSDRFALDKAKFHYVDAKSNDVLKVCAAVSAEFGVKMTVKFARSSAGARGHFNLKSISW